jgi:uncharacterized surface protein with fasciclin (FAS1) repeats
MVRHLVSALALAGLVATGVSQAKGRPDGPGKPGDTNIVDLAKAVNAQTGEFSYLLAAVGCLTDDQGNNPVVDLLSGDDTYTLFAPNDEAFMALQEALGLTPPAPENTCSLPDDLVFDVLAYHVTEGRRFSNSLFNRKNSKKIEMLNGGIVTSNPNLTLTDVAGQTVAVVPPLVNVNASNGVIHQVDTVLLPFKP